MIGEVKIRIVKQKVVFDLIIKRKITIIKGDSATGKTTLLGYIEDFEKEGNKSGVEIDSGGVSLHVLDKNNWKENIKFYKKSVIFIDEANNFVNTKEFAKVIKNSSNYFVIITREKLAYLSISVDEIYGIKCSGKIHTLSNFYDIKDKRWFKQNKKIEGFNKIVTEDKGSGYQFFENCSKNYNIKCMSAKTNSKVHEKINDNDTMIIVDAAGFGAYMEECVEKLKVLKNTYIYLPESFEWLILKSGILKNRKLKSLLKEPISEINENKYFLKNILDKPFDYIDSSYYESWETFFYDVLKCMTREDRIRGYNKSKLRDFYKTKKSIEKVVKLINGEE